MNPLSSSSSATASTGDSLIGSLCREIDGLRVRALQLAEELRTCRDDSLRTRLRGELGRLEGRRRELQGSGRLLARSGLRDGLSLAFLLECTQRPLAEAGR